MKKFKLNTPVLFLVFNRLESTKKVFGEIKKAKPKELFISADGPRNEKEKEKTEKIRKYLLKNINWKCKVKTLFRDKNLGCKLAVSGGIDWFFENVEKGIILEDDCLPSQSFFRFCQEMLEKYKDEERICQISGTNVFGKINIPSDYLFSDVYSIWGWATWKRAWKDYDIKMKKWGEINKNKFIASLGYNFLDRVKSKRLYEKTYKNEIDTWDYQWDFVCKLKRKLAIIPKLNLITNIGFSSEATHTSNTKKRKDLKRFELKFPLTDNERIFPSKKYNKGYSSFFRTSISTKIKTLVSKKIFRKK